MQRPLQITFRGMEPSEAVERRIREKADELERFQGQIIGCHVTVESPHHHSQQGATFSVRLDVRVPQGEIVVNRDPGRNHAHEDVYVAIRDAFAAAVRQLEDHARQRRGKVKHHEEPEQGTITKIYHYEGYGFMETREGLEVYFHRNSVANGAFPSLAIGDEVRVVVDDSHGERGPQASTLVPTGRHRSVH